MLYGLFNIWKYMVGRTVVGRLASYRLLKPARQRHAVRPQRLGKKIIIEEPLVSASVQGSRNTPYKVVLKANQFGTFEKTKLIALIRSNPYYLSQLHAGFLPKQLLQVCNNEKFNYSPLHGKTCPCSAAAPIGPYPASIWQQ